MSSTRPYAPTTFPVGTLEKTLKRKHIHVPPLGGGLRVLPGSLVEKVAGGELSDKELFFLSELSGFALWKLEKPSTIRLVRERLAVAVLTKSYRRVIERLLEMELIEVALNSEGKESYSTLHHTSKQYRLNPLLTRNCLTEQLFGRLAKEPRGKRTMEEVRAFVQAKIRPYLVKLLPEFIANFKTIRFDRYSPGYRKSFVLWRLENTQGDVRGICKHATSCGHGIGL